MVLILGVPPSGQSIMTSVLTLSLWVTTTVSLTRVSLVMVFVFSMISGSAGFLLPQETAKTNAKQIDMIFKYAFLIAVNYKCSYSSFALKLGQAFFTPGKSLCPWIIAFGNCFFNFLSKSNNAFFWAGVLLSIGLFLLSTPPM